MSFCMKYILVFVVFRINALKFNVPLLYLDSLELVHSGQAFIVVFTKSAAAEFLDSVK